MKNQTQNGLGRRRKAVSDADARRSRTQTQSDLGRRLKKSRMQTRKEASDAERCSDAQDHQTRESIRRKKKHQTRKEASDAERSSYSKNSLTQNMLKTHIYVKSKTVKKMFNIFFKSRKASLKETDTRSSRAEK